VAQPIFIQISDLQRSRSGWHVKRPYAVPASTNKPYNILTPD